MLTRNYGKSGLIVADYPNNRYYRVYINAGHITIRDDITNKVLFNRDDASKDEWWDEKHGPIEKLIFKLEDAILAAVEQ